MLAFSDNIPNISNKRYICKHLSFHLLKHSYSSPSHPMLFEDTHFYIYCNCRILMIVFCECMQLAERLSKHSQDTALLHISFLPMYPRPLSIAIVLCGSIDVFVEKSNVFSAINPVSDCEIALNPFRISRFANLSVIDPTSSSVCAYSSVVECI